MLHVWIPIEISAMQQKNLHLVTLLAALYVWALLLWDYTHTGVPTHHIMARADMPGFSNWWGGLLIPLVAWFLTTRLQQRLKHSSSNNIPASIIYTFIGALLYAVILCLMFTLRGADVPFYMLVGLLGLALFFPIYRAEFFLGLVLGMIHTFGGVLPVIIVSVITGIGAAIYWVGRLVKGRLVKK